MHLSNTRLDEKNTATSCTMGFQESSFPQVHDMLHGTLGVTKGEAQNTLHVQEFWI